MLSLSLALAMTRRLLSYLTAIHPDCAALCCRRDRGSLGGAILSRASPDVGFRVNFSNNVVDVFLGLGNEFARLAADPIGAAHGRFDQRVDRSADLRQG